MEDESFVELQEARSPEQSEKECKRLRVEAECLGVCCRDFRDATDGPCGLGGKEPLRAALTICLFFLQHPLLKPVQASLLVCLPWGSSQESPGSAGRAHCGHSLCFSSPPLLISLLPFCCLYPLLVPCPAFTTMTMTLFLPTRALQ